MAVFLCFFLPIFSKILSKIKNLFPKNYYCYLYVFIKADKIIICSDR